MAPSSNQVVKDGGIPQEVDEAALEAVMREVPRGAFALSALTVGLLLLCWFLVYFFIFLPRGMIG